MTPEKKEKMRLRKILKNRSGIFLAEKAGSKKLIKKETKKNLYVSRKVKNTKEIIDFAKSQGIEKILDEKDLHITLAYSKDLVDWDTFKKNEEEIEISLENATVIKLGDSIALSFQSDILKKSWQKFIDSGASWDYDGFTPHISLSYHYENVDVSKMEKFNGKITLEKEVFEEVDEEKTKDLTKILFPSLKQKDGKTLAKVARYIPFAKIDKKTKTVSGIASTEAIDGAGDIISFEAVAEALPDYMKFGNIREMHQLIAIGSIVDYKLDAKKKELWIDVKISDDQAWKKVQDGVYKGFSIGGGILEWDYVQKEAIDDDGNTYVIDTEVRKVTKIVMNEISLVDRPCNPEALLDMYKSVIGQPLDFAFIGKEKNLLKRKSNADMLKSVNIHQEFSIFKKVNFNNNIMTQEEKKVEVLKKAQSAAAEMLEKNYSFNDKTPDQVVSITHKDLGELLQKTVETTVEAVTEDEKTEETPTTPTGNPVETPTGGKTEETANTNTLELEKTEYRLRLVYFHLTTMLR